MVRLLLGVLVTLCALCPASAARCPVQLADMGESADTVLSNAGGARPITDLLTEMSIPLSKDCLLTALGHENPEVRNLVAMEAAREGIKEAVPIIERLMASETEPYARIQFAADLAGLGETRGFEMLEGYCSNAAEPIAARLRAARVLEVDLKRQSCAQVLVAALKDREPTYRMDALTLIPYARNLAATEFLQLDNLLLNSLFDENRSVRITAAHTAEKLGDASAISALQIALASESDRDVQEAMHSAVKSLQSQQP